MKAVKGLVFWIVMAGVQAGWSQSAVRVEALRTAAEAGDAASLNALGDAYANGLGVVQDDAAAAAAYLAAAQKNFGPAQNNLGLLIAEGRGGLTPDLTEAYAWLSLAVENGSKPAVRDIVARRLSELQMAEARAKLVTLRSRLGRPPVPAVTETVSSAVPATVSPAIPSPELPVAAAAGVTPSESTGASQKSAENLADELTKLREVNLRLMETLRLREREKSELEARLATPTPTASVADPKELADARETIIRLTEENTRLRSSASPVSTTVSEGEALRAKLADAEARIRHLSEDTKRLNDEVKRSILEMGRLRREIDIRDRATAVPPSDAMTPR